MRFSWKFFGGVSQEDFKGRCYRKGSLGDRNGSPRNSPRHTAQSQVPHHRCHPDWDDEDDDDHCHSNEDGNDDEDDGDGNADENDQGHDDKKFKQGVVDMMIMDVHAMIADDRDAGG